jgi:hypothetical protein
MMYFCSGTVFSGCVYVNVEPNAGDMLVGGKKSKKQDDVPLCAGKLTMST